MDLNIQKTCILCNSTNLMVMKNYQPHDLVKCRDCRFVFMRKIPSNSELLEYYETYSYGNEQNISSVTIKRYHELLDEFEQFRKTNNILDVGCGMGFFLEEAKKRGWNVFGTEFSETAVRICEEKGIAMREGKLDFDLFEEKFDIITSFEVLEHINNPIEELKKIHHYLRNEGLFYCTTPNFNSYLRFYLKEKYNIITYPEHLSYYTKSTLNKIMKRNGFICRKFLSTGISITRLNPEKIDLSKSFYNNNPDEELRKNIDNKWYLIFLKKVINQVLTILNLGMTLKGYYIKK